MAIPEWAKGKTYPKKNFLIPFVLLVIIVLIISSLIFLNLASKSTSKKDPATNEVQVLVSQVGKLISLPKNETPTIATVSDVAKLKDQSFFKSAKNGDKILIYTKNKKIILFRPSENKVIEIANLKTNGIIPTPTLSLTPRPSSTPTLTPTPFIPTSTPASASATPNL